MGFDPAGLVNWFDERPYWTQEAVRRLCANGDFSSGDFRDFAEMCRKQLADPEWKPDLPALPPHVFSQNTDGRRVRLTSIGAVKGIDALNPKTPVTFGPENLTIAYGGTGVGKTGLTRILKSVCGSRSSRRLLCNVFEGKTLQSCKIGYTLDGTDKEIEWKPSDATHPDLSSVEVFDTECGQVYVNAAHEVVYEPWLLQFMQRLVDACGTVDGILQGAITALPTKKPMLPPEYVATNAGKWYSEVQAGTNGAEVATSCDWLPAHGSELETLQARIAEKDPVAQARQLRARRDMSNAFLADLKKIATGLSQPRIAELFNARNAAATKRKTASEDAKKVFDQAPLEGVGLESWKALWQFARSYSEDLAYQEHVFPHTGDQSRCVLCQQSLGEEAKRRLVSFETFVKGESESAAANAEAAFAALVAELPIIPDSGSFEERISSLGLVQEPFAQSLRAFRDAAAARRAMLPDAASLESLAASPDTEVLTKVEAFAAAFETAATIFDVDAQKVNKKELNRQARELNARKWLHDQRDSIKDEIARLRTIAAIEAARKLTNTTALSKKKGLYAQELVSDAFVRRFNDELAALGAGHIKVELKQSGTGKGRVFHQIRLKSAKLGEPVSDVLSEGERRVVSLAAFLADAEGNDSKPPLVFDDPVTSVDQDFEESIAGRLVELSSTRQVIIFTHRLSLLTLLDEAGEKLAPPRVFALNRMNWGTGEPSDTPFYTKAPGKAVNSMLNESIARLKTFFADNTRNEYNIHAKGLCSEIRILVERLIEDTLLNQVIRRFRRAVVTKGKIGALAKISADDCRMIEDMMSKYSRYEHSQPQELPVPMPEPDEINADLMAIKEWVEDFSKRLIPQPTRKT